MVNYFISVIVPVYNGGKFLADAFNSIIRQSLLPHEIIIVDDGSTDDTPALIVQLADRSPIPVIHLRQENMGPAAARNRALCLAKGNLIAFQDADDIWTDHKLEVQIQVLENHPGSRGARGYVQLFRHIHLSEQQPMIEERQGAAPLLCLQSVIIRRSVIDEVGLLDEKMRWGEDVDWMMRAQEKGVLIMEHPDVVLLYRRHAGNMTLNLKGAHSGMIGAIAQSLKRRRSMSPQGND